MNKLTYPRNVWGILTLKKSNKLSAGVPIVAQQVKNLTSIHEGVGLIPGLTQWIKDPALLQAEA